MRQSVKDRIIYFSSLGVAAFFSKPLSRTKEAASYLCASAYQSALRVPAKLIVALCMGKACFASLKKPSQQLVADPRKLAACSCGSPAFDRKARLQEASPLGNGSCQHIWCTFSLLERWFCALLPGPGLGSCHRHSHIGTTVAGLVAGILLLGYGLVAIPRKLWRTSDPEASHRWALYRSGIRAQHGSCYQRRSVSVALPEALQACPNLRGKGQGLLPAGERARTVACGKLMRASPAAGLVRQRRGSQTLLLRSSVWRQW